MSDYGSLVPSGAAPQTRYNFQPTITPATPTEWSIAYTTQAGLMIVDGAMAFLEITLAFTPTYTANTGGVLKIAGHPIPFVSQVGALQVQAHTANITYPSAATFLIGRIASDFSGINLIGLKSAGSGFGLTASGLVSGAATSLTLGGWVRVG